MKGTAVGAIRRRMSLAWAVAIVLGGAAWGLARHAAATLPHPAPFAELAYYPSGRWLRPAVLGHAETAADLAWLRAVQYYGEHRRTDNRFDHLGHVFDILTTLSPRFVNAYVFGAFALAQEGRHFDLGEKLLQAGLQNNPTSGRLAFETGFFYFVKPGRRDLRQAAEYFELATHLPGSPVSSAKFAAFARQNSGNLLVALGLWREVRNSTQNLTIRDTADREIARIQAALAAGRIEAAMDRVSTPYVLFRRQP